METHKLAIVILNYNGMNFLRKFMSNTVKHSEKFAIYVIDNNSSDDSLNYLNDEFPDIKVIKNDSNLGYAGGYNQGLKQINSEYYILLNSDVEVVKGWITPILSFMDKNPDVAACQPKILDFNNKTHFEHAGACGGFLDILGYPFCRGRIFENLEIDNGQYNDNIETFWATGACLFIRSSSFWKVNGFDKDFFAHMEEIDLCWRLKNINQRIFCIPESYIFHVGGGTLQSSNPKKTMLNFRNNYFMLFKNLTIFEILAIFPLRIILDVIASVQFLFNSGFSHFLAVYSAILSFIFYLPKNIVKRSRQNIKLQKRFKSLIIIKFFIQKIVNFKDL